LYSARDGDLGSGGVARTDVGSSARAKLGSFEVIPRSDFSFNAAASSTTEIPIAVRVDITACVSGILVVRLHAKSFASTTAQTVVAAQAISYSEDEPTLLFMASFPTFALITIANADAPPRLHSSGFNKPASNMARVVVQHLQGLSTGICTLTLSAELVLRDG
jgi:hypothetical protein